MLTPEQIETINMNTWDWPTGPAEAVTKIASGKIKDVSRWTMKGNVEKIAAVLRLAGLLTEQLYWEMESLADQCN